MDARADRLIELFHEAKARPAGAGRDAFLRTACGGDVALTEELCSLLAAHGELGAFLEPRSGAPLEAPALERPGDRLGPYQLLDRLGEGGCGVVYLAEQTAPVRRQVAIKIIKLGMDTRAVVARFEAERQALAMMEHPHIAKVLDAGTTEGRKSEVRGSKFEGTSKCGFPSGRPYFVMELVRGIRITEYCDQEQLSTRDRLDLFIKVCHAIQHAHQKGIVHRDLKPSNILVTVHDGVPVPKVIDFGIAKAITDQSFTDQTVFTAFEQFLGTPAYMSPEQAGMSGLDVDTRSDIYSLGVLLYELLTGSTPFEARELMQAGVEEMRRTIREEEPIRPSTRLTQLHQQQQSEARPAKCRRRTAPFKSGNRDKEAAISSDLDWIVMKCLEKDRARRYETANGLAADLQRYLNDEPVVARPPSTAYRFRKAFRRHRLAFTTAAMVAASLVLGIAGSLWQAGRAYRAQAEADAAAAREQTQRYVAERQLYAARMHLARLAFEENHFTRLREILKQTANDPDRGFEWYYWQRQAHLELKTLRGHLAPVVAVGYSPDGRKIVTGSFDHTARIWDAEGGEQVAVLRGHRSEVTAVAFSPDGRWIVTGGADTTVRVWEAASGKTTFRLDGHTNRVTSVAFSPDGLRIASASFDGIVRLWDAESGRELRLLDVGSAVWTVAFSKDGRCLLTASGDEAARLWDAENGESAFSPIQPPSSSNPALGSTTSGLVPFSAAFSPDGQWVVTGSQDQTARVWERATGREQFPLRGKPHWLSPLHSDVPLTVAVSPDGRTLVTGRLDRTADVWSLSGRTHLFTLRGHEAEIAAVAISPDGQRVVTGSYDHTARIWDLTRSRESLTLAGHSMVTPTGAFSGDGQLMVTVSWDGSARVWDSATGRLLRSLPHGQERLWAVRFSPDDQWIITGGDEGCVRIWKVATGELARSLEGSTAGIGSLAFFPDGSRILVGDFGGKARVLDSISGQILAEMHESEEAVHAAVYPDGNWIVTVSESTQVRDGLRVLSRGAEGIVNTLFRGSSHVWSADGAKLFPLLGQQGGISTVAISPDGRRIAAGGMGQTVSLWDAATGREVRKLEGHGGRVVFTGFVPDGRRVLTSGFDDATTRVWDAISGLELLTLHRQLAVALSPDGRRVLAAGTPPATVLEIASEEEVDTWQREEQVARARIETERAERLAAAERMRNAGIED